MGGFVSRFIELVEYGVPYMRVDCSTPVNARATYQSEITSDSTHVAIESKIRPSKTQRAYSEIATSANQGF